MEPANIAGLRVLSQFKQKDEEHIEARVSYLH